MSASRPQFSASERDERIRELIDCYRNGGIEAGNELFDLVYGRLRTSIELRMGPLLRARYEVDEVLHEVWVEIAQSLLSCPPKQGFFPWARVVVHHKMIKLERKLKRCPRSEASVFARQGGQLNPIDPAAPISQAVDQAQAQLSLVEAIERLPTLQREVLQLSWIEQVPTREVAKILNRTHTDVLTIRARAGRNLAKLLKGGSQTLPVFWS